MKLMKKMDHWNQIMEQYQINADTNAHSALLVYQQYLGDPNQFIHKTSIIISIKINSNNRATLQILSQTQSYIL